MIRMATLEELFPGHASGYWGKDAGTVDHDVRIIRNGDVVADGSVRWDELPTRSVSSKELQKSRVEVGDLLLTTSGNCARVALIDRADGMVCASNFTRRLRTDPSIADPRYLFHLMRSEYFRGLCSPFIRGTTLENLSVKDAFRSVELPVPAIMEQLRIADVFDSADALRTKRRQTLAKLETLAQAIFIDMFGEPSSSAKGEWTVLEELVREGDRINYGVVQPGDDVADGTPLIRVSDLVDGRVDHAAVKRINPDIDAKYTRSKLVGDEVLISCVGSTGAVALASDFEKGWNIARAVARVPLQKAVQREYIAAFLRMPFVQRYFRNELRTVSQPTLNIRQIRETPVLLPPADERGLFVERLGQLDVVRRKYLRHSSELDRLFGSLQQRAFRGEL